MIPDEDPSITPILLEAEDDDPSNRLGWLLLSHMPTWAQIIYRIVLAYFFVFAGVKCLCDEEGDLELFDGMPS